MNLKIFNQAFCATDSPNTISVFSEFENIEGGFINTYDDYLIRIPCGGW